MYIKSFNFFRIKNVNLFLTVTTNVTWDLLFCAFYNLPHTFFSPEYFKKYFFWCCFTFPLHAQDTVLYSNFCYNLNFKLLFLFCTSLFLFPSFFPSFFPSTLLFFLLSFLPSVHPFVVYFFFLNQHCHIKVYFIFPVSYNAEFSNNHSESAESSVLEKHLTMFIANLLMKLTYFCSVIECGMAFL